MRKSMFATAFLAVAGVVQAQPRVLVQISDNASAPMMVNSILERAECVRLDVTFRDGETDNYVNVDYNSKAIVMEVGGVVRWSNSTGRWTNLAKDLCNCLLYENCSDVRTVRAR